VKDARLAIAYETVAHVEECSGRYPEAIAELAHAESLGAMRPRSRKGAGRQSEHRAELLDQLRKKTDASWLRQKAAELIRPEAQATPPDHCFVAHALACRGEL